MARWTVGEWTITRVDDPGFALVLPQDAATTEALKSSPWLRPDYVTDDWALRVGSSALLLTGPGSTIVVDPWLAFDDDAKVDARLAALAEAGARAEDVDIVVNSHIDGAGLNLVPGSAAPVFPNAAYLLPAAELEAVRAGRYPAVAALAEFATPVDGTEEIAPGVTLEPLPGHNDGHVGVWVGDGAVITGHLFLHPALVANPDNTSQDVDKETVRHTRHRVLERCAEHGTVLICHLFAEPGGGRVLRDDGRWALSS